LVLPYQLLNASNSVTAQPGESMAGLAAARPVRRGLVVGIRIHRTLRLANVLLDLALQLVHASFGMHASIVQRIADVALHLASRFPGRALRLIGGALPVEIFHPYILSA
jgi:hypothetical protein